MLKVSNTTKGMRDYLPSNRKQILEERAAVKERRRLARIEAAEYERIDKLLLEVMPVSNCLGNDGLPDAHRRHNEVFLESLRVISKLKEDEGESHIFQIKIRPILINIAKNRFLNQEVQTALINFDHSDSLRELASNHSSISLSDESVSLLKEKEDITLLIQMCYNEFLPHKTRLELSNQAYELRHRRENRLDDKSSKECNTDEELDMLCFSFSEGGKKFEMSMYPFEDWSKGSAYYKEGLEFVNQKILDTGEIYGDGRYGLIKDYRAKHRKDYMLFATYIKIKTAGDLRDETLCNIASSKYMQPSLEAFILAKNNIDAIIVLSMNSEISEKGLERANNLLSPKNDIIIDDECLEKRLYSKKEILLMIEDVVDRRIEEEKFKVRTDELRSKFYS